MSDINVNALSEAINDKMDRDGQNVDTTSGADSVIAYQVPTAENNYMWYRLYASGWVEQGGITTGTSSYDKQTVNLPVTMADTNYFSSATIRWGNGGNWYTNDSNGTHCAGITDVSSPIADITTTSFSIQAFSMHVWEVKGMSASSLNNSSSGGSSGGSGGGTPDPTQGDNTGATK